MTRPRKYRRYAMTLHEIASAIGCTPRKVRRDIANGLFSPDNLTDCFRYIFRGVGLNPYTQQERTSRETKQ